MSIGRFLAAGGLVLVLAGCTQTPEAPPPFTAKAAVEDFDALALQDIPGGWRIQRGVWGVAQNATDAPHSRALMGMGAANPGFSSILAPVAVEDFEANVSFKMLSGDHPQGAGLVFHFQDDANYQILRYSVSEMGWHLFTVMEGNRQKQRDATMAEGTGPELHQWVHLRVRATGGHVLAYDGQTKVIDFELPAGAARAGAVGPFVRGDTVAAFDDLEIRPL